MANQTRLGSALESILAALLAAPTSWILKWYVMLIFNDNFTDPDIKNTYLFLEWVIFLIHSAVWKYVLRRAFVKYGFKLEPHYIYNRFILRNISR